LGGRRRARPPRRRRWSWRRRARWRRLLARQRVSRAISIDEPFPAKPFAFSSKLLAIATQFTSFVAAKFATVTTEFTTINTAVNTAFDEAIHATINATWLATVHAARLATLHWLSPQPTTQPARSKQLSRHQSTVDSARRRPSLATTKSRT